MSEPKITPIAEDRYQHIEDLRDTLLAGNITDSVCDACANVLEELLVSTLADSDNETLDAWHKKDQRIWYKAMALNIQRHHKGVSSGLIEWLQEQAVK